MLWRKARRRPPAGPAQASTPTGRWAWQQARAAATARRRHSGAPRGARYRLRAVLSKANQASYAFARPDPCALTASTGIGARSGCNRCRNVSPPRQGQEANLEGSSVDARHHRVARRGQTARRKLARCHMRRRLCSEHVNTFGSQALLSRRRHLSSFYDLCAQHGIRSLSVRTQGHSRGTWLRIRVAHREVPHSTCAGT